MSRPFANESAFRAIADPTRRAILDVLSRGDRTMLEIAREFRKHLSTISQHLLILRTSGLVMQRRQGGARVYRIVPHTLEPVAKWLKRQEHLQRSRQAGAQRSTAQTASSH